LTGLLYHTKEGQFYLYNQALYGPAPYPIGMLSHFLSLAKQAGLGVKYKAFPSNSFHKQNSLQGTRDMPERVVVVGASPKEERYSNKAVKDLAAHGHTVLPVHPLCAEIHGQACYKSLAQISGQIDTVTLYVGPDKSSQMIEEILGLHPARIIMNPGAENDALEEAAQARNIEVVRGCTLVMLRTLQF